MNGFAKRYFNLILATGAALGFVMPKPPASSGSWILVILAAIIFSSSFKVDFSFAFFKTQTKTILGFYVLRFLLLPVLLFFIITQFSSLFASAILLLFLMPSGVTSPAFTNVFEGNVSLALAILILSSAFVPLVVPFLSGMLLAQTFEIDRWQIFQTLLLTVILPYFLHLPIRKVKPLRQWISNHDAFISIAGIAVIFTLAIATYRDVLLSEPQLVVPYFLIGCVGFFLMYLFGWYGFWKLGFSNKVALYFSSGANNVALGLVITFLYFPKEIGVFFVMAEIVWVVMLIPAQWLMKRRIHAAIIS